MSTFLEQLISSNRLSNWGGRAVSDALKLTETFLAALPDASVALDLSTAQYAAEHFQQEPGAFGQFLHTYNHIQRASEISHFGVAFRSLIRFGAAAGEDLLRISEQFRNLIEDPRLDNPEARASLLSFFRGLVWKDWDFASSMIVLKDALDKQGNFDQTLRLCALSSTAGRAHSRPAWQRRDGGHVPAAAEFLAIDKVSDREIALATLLYHRLATSCNAGVDADAMALRLFTLFEICRFTEPTSPKAIFSKVEDAILSNEDPSELINILTVKQLRSQDTRTTQKAIEGLLAATTLKEFETQLELLRSVYNADVPPARRREAAEQQTVPLLEQQNEIFKQAMNAFMIFRQARHLIDRTAAELRPSQAEHPGVLCRFAAEIGNVSRVLCAEGIYPGGGVILSDIRAENAFELCRKGIRGPYHHYLQIKGWSQEGIDDFLASQIMITEELIVLSAPENTRYRFHGVELSAIFFRESPGNTSGSQCFLVPSTIVDAKLRNCTCSFWDTSILSKGVEDLSHHNFYPEAFELEARQKGLPFFDVGSPTNIGGFSNSRSKPPEDAQAAALLLNGFFGLGNKDPWGNPKKAELLSQPELFSKHLKLHSEIAPLITGYSRILAILLDRYSAFKRGDTPDNSNLDVGIISDLAPLPAGMVMLEEAYRQHCYLHAASARPERFPKIRFFQRDRLHLGAVSNFELDTFAMKLTVADGTMQLPTLRKSLLHAVDDSVVRSLCVSAEAVNAWQLYVRPHLGGLVPFLCFE